MIRYKNYKMNYKQGIYIIEIAIDCIYYILELIEPLKIQNIIITN